MEDFEIENGVLTEYQGEDVDVIVPEGVREIGEGAFWRCDVESVRLPQGIRAIRSEAFMNCRSLRRINLPESVRTIETEAFHGSGLRAIRLPRRCGTDRKLRVPGGYSPDRQRVRRGLRVPFPARLQPSAVADRPRRDGDVRMRLRLR